MPIIKCKMCGGDIELAADKTFGTCEYCGSTMTLPKVSDEQRAAAFNRGNHFRRIGEFDKALAVYERIVAEDDNDAEAHWCCALCRFGIEYVEDPATYEWLPTCHRASFDSFLEDVDYLAALENSDGITRRQYQKDAAKIAEVQRGILATSQNTEPYDVFISYKELDENGNRTRDSILAQEIYYRLTEKGWRVFFSRISLEDVPGTEYEPYIFAALNSAKVMIVVGTSAENLNAVWVKNEWSRFLSMMRKDRTKLLIPCYRDMDPYDLPEQLSVLMSYDMGKIGFVQDLIRGVDKVLSAEKKDAEPVKETIVVQQSSGGPNVTALLKRGQQALEDGEWDKASEFFDQVLNMDAENAEAFLGLALAENRCSEAESYFQKICTLNPKKEFLLEERDDWKHTNEMIKKLTVPNYLESKELAAIYDFKTAYESETRSIKEQVEQIKAAFQADRNLSRAFRYAQGATKQKLDGLKNELFGLLDSRLSSAEAAEALSKEQAKEKYAAKMKEADEYAEKKNRAALEKKDQDYLETLAQFTGAASVSDYEAARRAFLRFGSYKDSVMMAERCRLEIGKLEKAAAEEAERRRQEEAEEAEHQRVLKEKAERERQAKKKKLGILAGVIIAVAIVTILVVTKVVVPKQKYNSLVEKYGKETVDTFLALKVGDIYTFGNYEQDNDTSNGTEGIDWLVLAKEDGKVLLISKYAIDCKQYHTEYDDVTWESCFLRMWLNHAFLDNAFNAAEKARICISDLAPYAYDPNNNRLMDRVFLLDSEEVEKYFQPKEIRPCLPTAFAIASGINMSDYNIEKDGMPSCAWWLRPSDTRLYASGSSSAECFLSTDHRSYLIVNGEAGVRPALWIALE